MLGLRITASAVMLALLLTRLHVASLLPTHHASTVAWLVAGLALTAFSIVLSTLRWQRVLTALDRPAPLSHLVSHQLAGMFVGNFLPSTIGGDLLRVNRLAGDNNDRPTSFASVVLERLSGWIVLPVITLGSMALYPSLARQGQGSTLALVLALGTLALLLAGLFAAAHPRLGGRLAHNEGWLRFAGAVHLGVDRFRRRPGALVSVLVSGFAYQLCVVLAAYCAARALGLDVGLRVLMAFFPAVAIAQVLPVTFAGLGVREGALVLFLAPFNVGSGPAIALGLLCYGMTLGVSLLGAPPFAAGARRPSRVVA